MCLLTVLKPLLFEFHDDGYHRVHVKCYYAVGVYNIAQLNFNARRHHHHHHHHLTSVEKTGKVKKKKSIQQQRHNSGHCAQVLT